MKKLLTIIVLITIGFNLVGQDKVVSVKTVQPVLVTHIPPYDSTKLYNGTLEYNSDMLLHTSDTFYFIHQPKKLIDTVPVLIVYIDTAYKNYNIVKWKHGYEVREKYWECCNPSIQTMAAYYWNIHKSWYLDENKKPLSKSIVVLITK